MPEGTAEAAIAELITSFNDLNAAAVDELDAEPSPLEFMRSVSRNFPFVIRGGASTWRAVKRWDAEYLKSVLGGQMVNVAVTPSGCVSPEALTTWDPSKS
jgi:peptidyl-lysine (3S)-dioxygenase / protease